MNTAKITALKFGLSLAIATYVVIEVNADAARILLAINSVTERWHRLGFAFALILASLGLGVVRWHFITQAVGIALTLKQAFRLGAMAYALSFAGFGAIGGDLFKAGVVARDNPESRIPAIISVAADRIVGLFALLLLASVASLLVYVPVDSIPPGPELRTLIIASVSVTMFAGLVIAPALGSAQLAHGMLRQLDRLWPAGSILHRVVFAVGVYRSHPRLLLRALLLSFCIHALNVLGIYLIAMSLSPPAPGLAEQFLIVPLALLSGVIPLPMGSLGVLDYSMSHLYSIVTADRIAMSQGFLTTMLYRLISATIAILGTFFFLTSQYGHQVNSVSKKGPASLRATSGVMENTDAGDRP